MAIPLIPSGTSLLADIWNEPLEWLDQNKLSTSGGAVSGSGILFDTVSPAIPITLPGYTDLPGVRTGGVIVYSGNLSWSDGVDWHTSFKESSFNIHKNVNPIDHPDGSITDVKIGNRTVDQALAGGANTGTLTQLLSWIVKQIKTIKGSVTNWYDAASSNINDIWNKIITHTHSGAANDGPNIPWANISSKPATFTPSAHKTTHATGGTDALVPADIGAAPSSHTHTKSQITDFAHAASHASGSSDPITPASIGAAAVSHTQTRSTITDFAHKSTHASGGTDALTPTDIGAVSKAGDTINGNLNVSGNITASGQVWGAVYNDLAELYPKADDDLSPGDVLIMTDRGVTKSQYYSDKRVIGVYSDSYGFLLGGELDCNMNDYIPVALCGRVKVKTCGIIHIGDLLTSNFHGEAVVASNYQPGTIIGKALENKFTEDPERIWMQVYNI